MTSLQASCYLEALSSSGASLYCLNYIGILISYSRLGTRSHYVRLAWNSLDQTGLELYYRDPPTSASASPSAGVKVTQLLSALPSKLLLEQPVKLCH